MKLLYCESCFSLVVPHQRDKVVRWCPCGESACWWDDGARGNFAIFRDDGNARMVSGLGLHNGLLRAHFRRMGETTAGSDLKVAATVEDAMAAIEKHEATPEYGCIQADAIAAILEATPSNYVFKQVGSLIIRFRPGFTSDVRFVSDPKQLPEWQVKEELKPLREPLPASQPPGA